jgi:18S rRNA (guanine1575-N7)-methyltransferase
MGRPKRARGGGGDGDAAALGTAVATTTTAPDHAAADGRPEDTAGGAVANYAGGEAGRYHGCATVRRIQAELSRRALALMTMAEDGDAGSRAAAVAATTLPPPLLALDLGCGSGLSGAELEARGVSRWLGLDISPDMLEIAASSLQQRQREQQDERREDGAGQHPPLPPPPGSRGDLVLADLGQGLPLRAGALADAAVSISAVQWLLEAPTRAAAGGRLPIDRFFGGLARCLLLPPAGGGEGEGEGGNNGSSPRVVAAIQAYGRDRNAALEVAAAARRAGFRAAAVADWPHRTRAIKTYVMLGRGGRRGGGASLPCAEEGGGGGAGGGGSGGCNDDDDDDDEDPGLYAPPQCALVGHVDAGCSLWWQQRRRRRRAGGGGQGCGGQGSGDDRDHDAWVLQHHRAAARRLCRLLWGAAARAGELSAALAEPQQQQQQQEKKEEQQQEEEPPWLVATLDVSPPSPPQSSSSSSSSCWGGLAVTVIGSARALELGGILTAAAPSPVAADALSGQCAPAVARACCSGPAAEVAAARLSARAELEVQAERMAAVPERVYEGARWWGTTNDAGGEGRACIMSGAADQSPVVVATAAAFAALGDNVTPGAARRLLERLLRLPGRGSVPLAPLAAFVVAREDGSAFAAAAYYCCSTGVGGDDREGPTSSGAADAANANASSSLSPHVTAAAAAVRGDTSALEEALRPAVEALAAGLREEEEGRQQP